MPSQDRPQVIVVGAGVVGLSAACALARQGASVTVLERASAPNKISGPLLPRVSAFSPASMAFLDSLAAWPKVPERIRYFEHMWVCTDGDFDAIHFSANEVGQPALGAIAENDLLQYCLYQQASKVGVCLRYDTEWLDIEQQADGVSLSLASNETLAADWLLVAEGAQSALRDKLAIKRRGWAYRQRAIVCSIQWQKAEHDDKPALAHTAWQRFLSTGPLALLPLASDESSLVWSLEEAEYERLMGLPEEAFVTELNAAIAELAPAKALAVGKRFSFPLQLAQAESYWQGRCLLLGDAAHNVHPLAGHGLNLGLMDVRDLAVAFENGASDQALAAWQRKRRAKATEMMLLTDGLYRLFRMAGSEHKAHGAKSFWQYSRAHAFRGLLSTGMAAVGGSRLLRQQLSRIALSAD